ncbi:MAG: hypothetical protein IKU29_01610 [Parabacteroides sp.]|nr:hypothetical protein [Parabacteroides sp.]
MQIINGKLCYDMDEIPRAQVFKDLGYQIIATDDPNKVYPIMRYLLFNEVNFLVKNNLLSELQGKDIEEYFDNGLNKLVDVVVVKFFKYLREMAKDKNDPYLGDLNNYYENLFSYIINEKYDAYVFKDSWDNNYANAFQNLVVRPSLRYLLDKYCDKQYQLQIIKTYNVTISEPLEDNLEESELVKSFKKRKADDETVVPIFMGYVRRMKEEELKEEEN